MAERIKFNVQKLDLCIETPIDVEKPLNWSFDGQIKLYYKLLNEFEPRGLDLQMALITQGVNNKDWLPVTEAAHTLEASSGYIGGGRIHFCCCHI